MLNIEKVIQNFEVYTYSKTNNILINNTTNFGDKNILYVVAGPNGSGKSTFIANAYELGFLSTTKYVNADITAQTQNYNEKNIAEKNYLAMFDTMNLLKNLAPTHQSIIYETVLSHPSKVDIVKLFKNNNYKIFTIFISPNNYNINIERVKTRVLQGGHDVPVDKIKNRFNKSHQLKLDLKQLSDIFYEIDNSILPTIINIEKQNQFEKDKQ